MAVTNSIAPRQNVIDAKEVTYKVNGADVRLTPGMVKKYLTNGDGNVTDQEVIMFINLCKYQGLNPLVRDAYLIKYGNSKPATIVTSKDAIMKRAMKNPRYAGHTAGVVVIKENDTTPEYRVGSLVLAGEYLVGGWAKTFIQGYSVPIETVVGFEEYAGKTKEGKLNSMWASKPGTMIRKVALVASLREAFPDDLQGMYASEEVNAQIDDTMVTPVEYPERPEEPQEQQIMGTVMPPEMPEIEPGQQLTINADNIGADELSGLF